ncbi:MULTISPECIES: YdaS family helix-turn-helix protein [unclassified Mesorhizobium]|uniref:YdaS family helix-turn-helix protein n=1 Tax=unclassified Mesorhizobium TaxID=325217 RepID=UPI000FCAAF47|nr:MULTISPECIES: YdaS family helix-turn-helix protein [unclassified Mesorhizobium]TGP29091.1 helix-turn-helix domain-containing protein [Mesorhizobium sp. M2D.F.Ca.ET.232.01.1.1]TGQ44067.1 helix-turn-helix domain-containing protein [Mesorhizobium sp. M00.F.Ca.ET.220.01.1.1]TGT95020.1 helix-turn-helix domain-containing protein [bacterium M00.F.Ca.ET.163.01.1.1]
MADIRTHIERAVLLLGSQAKLAHAAGCSQQYISLLLQGKTGLSAEKAIDFERATDGAVSKSQLRPDIFGAAPERAA